MFSESFLVSFFSTVICRDLDWVGVKTIDALALGALLHDIGMVQLPPSLVERDKALLTDEERAHYHTHPALGVEAIKNVRGITPAVLDIILQHHESVDTSGFPKKLSGNRIFPLAKIVGLADGFTSFIKEKEMAPVDCLKEFISTPSIISKYDPQLVKNLIKGMIT